MASFIIILIDIELDWYLMNTGKLKCYELYALLLTCCWEIFKLLFTLFIAPFVLFAYQRQHEKSQHLWNKHIIAWKMLCTIFIHSLMRIRKLTRSLRLLVRFLILHNSWIQIVRAHFPWSNLYIHKHFHKVRKSLIIMLDERIAIILLRHAYLLYSDLAPRM